MGPSRALLRCKQCIETQDINSLSSKIKIFIDIYKTFHVAMKYLENIVQAFQYNLAILPKYLGN